MSVCIRCGRDIPENGIHLYTDWPGRKEDVQKAYPDSEISFCKEPIE